MKWAAFCVWLGFSPAPALALTAYVTNERDNTISVVDLDQMKTIKTIQVGQRPRGITMTKDGSQILVCASDDDTIQIIDAATLRIVGDLPSGPDPETFALHVSGNPLFVSNESGRTSLKIWRCFSSALRSASADAFIRFTTRSVVVRASSAVLPTTSTVMIGLG